MLSAQNLNFHYDSRQVLHNINVELPAGSITGLIGPNGAGKSTLMRCMAGLECPSSGEVLLGGKPILANPRASFAQLGYLPDIFGLPEGLSVIQCLTYAAKSRGVSDGDLAQAVGSTVQLLGLADKLYSRVSNLSRGQKQRVGIGQVIIHRPKFLLLDEPASGLDPEARHELSLLLLQLQREGMTILVSSHILSELDEYCSHMLVIKQGQIQAFQALHGEGQPETQTVRLRFANRAAAEMAAAVRELAAVQSAEAIGDALHVVLPAGNLACAALLRDLVQRELPVCALELVRASLLESYQNTLNIQRDKS